MSNLDQLATEVHSTSVSKGFHQRDVIRFQDPSGIEILIPNPSMDGERIALIHSEASECLDALRKADQPLAEEELADVIIRALDFAETKGWSMDRAVAAKMAINKERPYMHGRQF